MMPSGATHMERATLPTRVELVPNVFANQSVVYAARQFCEVAAISVAARQMTKLRLFSIRCAFRLPVRVRYSSLMKRPRSIQRSGADERNSRERRDGFDLE